MIHLYICAYSYEPVRDIEYYKDILDKHFSASGIKNKCVRVGHHNRIIRFIDGIEYETKVSIEYTGISCV
jgi:hypothetical protein